MRPSSALLLLVGSLAIGGGLFAVAMLELPDAELRLLAAAAGVAVLVVGGLLARLLSLDARRLERVAEAADRLARGEIHVFAPTHGRGTLDDLATSLNRLGDRLREGHLEVEEQRALERAMVRESPNGLVVLDAAGRMRSCNPSFQRLLDMDGPLPERMPIEEMPLADLREVLEEAKRTRAPAERTASLGDKDLLVRGVPVADGAGVLGIVLDVSSLRLAERLRRDFVANVSHELRTPITAIVGYAEALQDERDRLPADIGPMIDAVHRNAERLGALVADVLHLSRIEARQADLPLEAEPVAPFVTEVVERYAKRAEQKGVALLAGPSDAGEAMVNGEALEHALNNLVDNALKYTPAAGRVVVSAWRVGERVRVDVADTGIGIDAAHHERIFERFYRVDAGRDRSVGGTGLGLALVKHICRASRAEVTFRSEPGKGTTFSLWLPTT